MWRAWLASWAIVLISLSPVTAHGARTQIADLRGYGRVSAALSPNRAVFTCESEAKADILFGKMLADIFWDAGAAHTTHTAMLGRRRTLIHDYPPYGRMIAAQCGRRVIVLGAQNDASVLKLAAREPALQSAGVVFKPTSPYPVYLDMYDLRSIQFYTTEMSSPYGYGLASHWPFIKRFGLGGISFGNFGFGKFCPAPGVVDWSPIDYEVRTAQSQGGMVIPGFDCSGQMPFWMWNSGPSSMMQPSPTTLMGAWSGLPACSAPFESWGMPADEQESGPLWFLRAVMARYGNNPAVGGWHIYAGSPGVEMGFHDRSTEFWDYSATGEQSFRNWLRYKEELSLDGLSRRWYGVPGHFSSWSKVALPDANSFFGDLDSSCLLLAGTWQWHDGNGDPNSPPADDAAGWAPFDAPPSQQLGAFPWETAYLRKSFNARDWLAKSKGSVYLVCDLDVRSGDDSGVWLNGSSLGSFHPQNGDPGAFAVDVTTTLKNGDNELVLRIPDEGKAIGPIFLTTTKPAPYPYLGAGRDAQLVDFKRWQADSIAALHNTVFGEARRLDPNRPMILSTGDIEGLADQITDLATRYNLGVQMTGREAWYFPWWAGLGLVDGFYGTSEPSNTPQGDNLDRMVGWMMIDGDSSDTLCWALEDFIKRERETGWFSKNARELQLFGKSLRAMPSIALLHSVQTTLVGDQATMQWDIGRGELQSAHYDNVYVMEREVENGKVSDYPVLFDCGTEIMDSRLVEAIRRYVEAGGTYIALENTGRHGFTAHDSYPISGLTGFKPGEGESGVLTFEKNTPLMGTWAGRQFKGSGFALDPLNNDRLAGIVPLARWQDGTVAVGYRVLGKGRVIYLGSTFWHDDPQVESEFFDRLFADLRVERNADAGSASVWARKYITKNGLQTWLIATNEDSTAQTTDLKLRVEHRPSQILDMLTKQPVPFVYTSDGWVQIDHVDFAPYGLRVFGVQRATLVGGLGTWWGEKTKYWSIRYTPSTPSAPAAATSAGVKTIPFTHWKFFADRGGVLSTSSAWAEDVFDDSSWQRIETGPWQLFGHSLAGYSGTGLYRASFALPAAWRGRRILLGLYSFDASIVYGTGDFFINGALVTTYHERGWNQTLRYDVTDLLRPGTNELAIRVAGGTDLHGLTGAVWLEPERNLNPSASLTGTWNAVAGDHVIAREVPLPGQVTAKYIWRDLSIPPSWIGRSIFLRIETPNQWLSMVMVNGHAIADDIYAHNYGTIADINITPYIHAGDDNRVELWPYATLVSRYGPDPQKSDEGQMTFTSIAVGCAK